MSLGLTPSPNKVNDENIGKTDETAEEDQEMRPAETSVTVEENSAEKDDLEKPADDVNEFDQENDDDSDEDAVNVIINQPSKGSIYKTGATYSARSQNINAQRK